METSKGEDRQPKTEREMLSLAPHLSRLEALCGERALERVHLAEPHEPPVRIRSPKGYQFRYPREPAVEGVSVRSVCGYGRIRTVTGFEG